MVGAILNRGDLESSEAIALSSKLDCGDGKCDRLLPQND